MAPVQSGWIWRFDRVESSDPTSYDGRIDDALYYTVDSQGNHYISHGYTTPGTGGGRWRSWVSKVGPDGTELGRVWWRTGKFWPTILTVDADDSVYMHGRVVDITGYDYFIKMNPDLTTAWKVRWVIDGYHSPTDLTIAPNGNLLVGLRGYFGATARVIELSSADGSFVQGVDLGSTWANEVVSPIVDSSGNIWFSEWLGNGQLVKVDSSLNPVTAWQYEEYRPNTGLWSSSRYQGGLDFGPDGGLYLQNYTVTQKFNPTTLAEVWHSTTTLPYDELELGFLDAWLDSGPICFTPSGDVISFQSRNYNTPDSEVGDTSGMWAICRSKSTGSVLWAYFLNAIWPSEDIIDAAGYVGNLYYNVWPNLNSKGVKSGPNDRFSMSMISYCYYGSGGTFKEMGYPMSYIANVEYGGTTLGAVELPMVYQYQYENRVQFDLNEVSEEMVAEEWVDYYAGRFVSASTPTFTSYTPTMVSSSLTTSTPSFSYESPGIDFWYKEVGAAPAKYLRQRQSPHTSAPRVRQVDR